MASIETICTPCRLQLGRELGDRRDRRRHRLQVRRPVLPPRHRGHPDAHDRGVLRHVDPRDDLIAQLVVLVLHHLRAHPSLLLLPRGHRASLSLTSGNARRAARGPGQQAHASRSLTSALTAAESDPRGSGPGGQAVKRAQIPQTCRRHGQPAAIQPPPQARTDPERRTTDGVTPASSPPARLEDFTRTRPAPMSTAVKQAADLTSVYVAALDWPRPARCLGRSWVTTASSAWKRAASGNPCRK